MHMINIQDGVSLVTTGSHTSCWSTQPLSLMYIQNVHTFCLADVLINEAFEIILHATLTPLVISTNS